MRKNVAGQIIAAQLVSSTDGSAVTSGTTTVYTTVDGGAQDAGVAATHEGNGCWTYAPSQALTNGNHVVYTFTNTSAVSVSVNVYPGSFDYTDAVRLGLTALPNAAADAAFGLPISDAGGLDLDTILDAAISSRMAEASINTTGGAVDVVTTLTNLPAITSNWLTAAGLATDAVNEIVDQVWDEAQADHVSVGSMGLIASEIATILVDTNELQTDWTDAGRLDVILDAVLADTGTDGVVLSAAQMNQVADHVIRRTQANARASADGDAVDDRSLLGQLSKVNNKIDAAVNPGNIVVYEEDDSSIFVTIPITTNASADPITVIDPP